MNIYRAVHNRLIAALTTVIFCILLSPALHAGDADEVRCVAFTGKGTEVFAACSGGLLRVWDLAEGTMTASVRTKPLRELTSVTCSSSCAYGADYKSIHVWSLPSLRLSTTLVFQGGYLDALALSPDGRRLARADYYGRGDMYSTVSIFNAGTGAEGVHMALPGDSVLFGPTAALAFSADGRLLAWGGRDTALHVWEAAHGRLLFKLPCIPEDLSPEGTRSIQFSPGESLIALTREGPVPSREKEYNLKSEVVLINYQDRTILHRSASSSVINALAFSPDGKKLAMADSAGLLRIMDTQKKTVTKSMVSYGACLTAVAWNREGSLLVTGDREGNVTLWDRETGEGKPLPGSVK
jgi:WD40 repeat protein